MLYKKKGVRCIGIFICACVYIIINVCVIVNVRKAHRVAHYAGLDENGYARESRAFSRDR